MSDHVLCYAHIVVDLAIVNLEDEADKGGENGCASGLRLDWRHTLALLWSYNGKTVKVACQDHIACVYEPCSVAGVQDALCSSCGRL